MYGDKLMTLQEVENILSIYKQSSPQEAFALFTEAQKLGPKTILEIGVAEGESLYLWSHLLDSDGLLIGIDAYDYIKWDKGKTKCKTVLIVGNTFDQSTLDEAKTVLGGREIDFLRIDGGHDYAASKNDFDRYFPLVRNGGLVAFHDYASSVEVKKFVDEIWDKYGVTRISNTDSVYLIKQG